MCSIREQVLHAEQFAKNPHLEVVYQGKPNAINLPFGNLDGFITGFATLKLFLGFSIT
jgi:hypothetical protein